MLLYTLYSLAREATKFRHRGKGTSNRMQSKGHELCWALTAQGSQSSLGAEVTRGSQTQARQPPIWLNTSYIYLRILSKEF
jgi:hypothetical protein